jgi:hypothetical protein
VNEPAQVFGEWRRTGYCCRCGDCCKGNPFTGSPEGYCPFFAVQWNVEREGWQGHCTDRTSANTYYTMACAMYPTHPSQIEDKPHCTYRFERIADGR